MSKPPFLPSALIAAIGVALLLGIGFNPPTDEASGTIALCVIVLALLLCLSGLVGMVLASARES